MPKKKNEEKVVGTMADMPDEGFVSTGVPEVDEMLGGGFPTHRITQVYGMPGVGKGYLMTMAMANTKNRILYVDAEFALNRDRARDAGVNLKDVTYLASSQLEEVAEYILDNLNKFDLIVVDSLAALTPMTIAQNDVGTSSIGLAARQIGHFVAKLRPKLYESQTAVVGINQVRANLGYGAAESKPFGSFAWNHAIDLSLKLYKGPNNLVTRQKAGEKYVAGHWCSVKVEKSRIGDYGAETKFFVDYQIGKAAPDAK